MNLQNAILGIMIKAVIFDIGNVLLRTTNLEPRRSWEQRLGLPDWGLEQLFFNSEVGQAAQVGKASTDDAWAHVLHTLGINERELPDLKRDFWAGDTWDHDLLALIHALKPRYKTGILSNAMPDARTNLKEFINEDLFDVIVFSGEEGIKKPLAEIYTRVLQRLEVMPAEAVFIDDLPANIKAAGALGIHTIHYTPEQNAGDVKAALLQLGIVL
jgi:epoxide hydrolase-like predicted phosphatase